MVRRLRKFGDDLRVATRVGRGLKDDGLKQLRAHLSRTRKRDERAAGFQQFEREQVNVLVTAQTGWQLRLRGHEFGRIENDRVKRFAAVTITAQNLKGVPFDELAARFAIVQPPLLTT